MPRSMTGTSPLTLVYIYGTTQLPARVRGRGRLRLCLLGILNCQDTVKFTISHLAFIQKDY